MRYTIKELRTLLDTKQLTVRSVLDNYFKNIKNNDKKFNSFITTNEQEAYQQAEIAQKSIDKGNSMSLTGIPFAIKDNISTKGILTTCGSKMLENYIPNYDATVIERLKDCGAIIIGKTNMDEFAMGSTGESSYFGKTFNPLNTSYVSGGSSSGSAAAVAADFVPIALGSDTGGSLRQPASFCGLTALNPTYGRVSRYGLIAFASSLDQIGIMAHTAEDCGLALNAIAGKDVNDITTANNKVPDFTSTINTDLKGKTIAIIKEFIDIEMDNDVRENFTQSVQIFKDLGAELKEISLKNTNAILSAYYLISSAEAFSALGRYDGIRFGYKSKHGDSYHDNIIATRNEGFGWEVKRRMLLGLYGLSSENYQDYYKKANLFRQVIRKEMLSLFEKYDYIISPTTPTTAYKVRTKEEDSQLYINDIATVITNMARVTAITTPSGVNAVGLPIGLQIMAKPFAEQALISACTAFQNIKKEGR